ncbi:MAG: class D beta-lactamase [Xanthomonadales bacterium]|nr:putative beta-lactamase YbxI [Xanthomonadales bacterium]MCC6592011.1 class D beta-lactamase [Xanthomonadales bacterium]
MRPASVLLFALAALAALAASTADAMLAGHFGRRYGALEIYDAQSKLSFRVNTPRLSERLPPCSTYLLPHFAIALGTGVLRSSDSRIEFDAARHPESANWPSSWRRDQTYASALKDSVQWYAQELSVRMGSERLQRNLKRIKYGNADVGGGLERFWMSSLRVSAFEQLDFLRAFRDGKLGFNPGVTRLLQEALVIERTPDYTIYGKYGSCPQTDDSYLGWLVGYVEKPGKVWYYALNLDGKSLAEFAGARLQIVKGAMQELGFLPGTPAPPVPIPRPASVVPAPEAQTAPLPGE